MRACVRARIRTWPSCACVHERALHVRLVCMRACRRRVLTGVRACRRLVCVRDRHVCAFTNVRCIDVSCACAPCSCCHERACASTSRVRRVRVVTSVLARWHLVCVRDRHMCAFTIVRCIDVSCAWLLFVAGARALWTFGKFPAAISIKCILIHFNNQSIYTYVFIFNRNSIAMLELEHIIYNQSTLCCHKVCRLPNIHGMFYIL